MTFETLLSEMSTDQKLHAMDLIWSDLLRSGAVVPAPEWHSKVLNDRLQKVKDGELQFEDLDTAAQDLRNEMREGKDS